MTIMTDRLPVHRLAEWFTGRRERKALCDYCHKAPRRGGTPYCSETCRDEFADAASY
jgi:hypothetical protein